MNFLTAVIISFSILIAGAIAIFRYRHIHRSYYYFIYFIWAGCFNEIISFFLVINRLPNSINNNIYVLFESLLIIIFFKHLKVLKNKLKLFLSIVISTIILWSFENIIQGKIVSVSPYFRIYYSLIIVLLSITTINNLITTVRKNVLTNSYFLICAGFIIYFTFKILIEAFWFYGLKQSGEFQFLVYNIMAYINLIINLIYALAILWMPRKQIFTMPS